ncbi:MAG: virulence RhuM family protein, partial [Desulfobulbaceae bacterium]|nr:virulence RhuM family protein [Desulfobulbaceae bacterium]
INQHLKRIFADKEREEAAVIKQYLTTAADGKNYRGEHYNLQFIIAVGFKIENERVQILGKRAYAFFAYALFLP